VYKTKSKTNMNDIILPARGQVRSQPRDQFYGQRVVYARHVPTVRRPLIIDVIKHEPVTLQPSLKAVVTNTAMVAAIVSQHDEGISQSRRLTTARKLGITARRTALLHHSLAKRTKHSKSLKSWFKKQPIRLSVYRLSLGAVAAMVLVATGYVGVDTWATNNKVKAQLTSQSVGAESVATATDAQARQAAEGTDTKPLPTGAVKNYTVAAPLPRTLTISKIHVNARILPMSVNPNGALQAPTNIFDAGWYTGSVQPGQIGAMLIDGHSSADHQALFGNLGKLVVGDTMQIEKGDGTRLTYKVVFTQTVDKDAVDMHQMLLPYGNAQRALNLITCAGDWINSQDTLTKRLEVFTEQI
jgi:LPXTG-site transpeptidase (sortase) family protein